MGFIHTKQKENLEKLRKSQVLDLQKIYVLYFNVASKCILLCL